MPNPFLKQMPRKTDLKIRMRLFGAWLQTHKAAVSTLVAAPLVAAMFLLVLTPTTPGINTDFLVTEVRAAQKMTATEARENVYYVLREVSEGVDKPAYVEATTGEKIATPLRVDRVESYQHNDTAITRIDSNTSARPFEVFLSRDHDDGLAMHHFGPVELELSEARVTYDEIHNIGSLYETFTSLETPAVPLLPETAEFISYDKAANLLTFVLAVDEQTEIEYEVAADNASVVSESVFVTFNGERYEMTETTYLTRTMLPASEFDSVFAPEQYDFAVVATRGNES